MFRLLYHDFLVELANHDEVIAGPSRWLDPEREMLLDASDAMEDAAKGWSTFARLIKEATTQGKERCLEILDVVSARDTLDDVIAAERHCFNQLVKLKP